MDSKAVSRGIRQAIWPALRAAGFNRYTSRVAWRHNPDTIDVVDLQSFNSYNAGVLGVTTFSFQVNLGKFLRYVPPNYPPKVKDGIPLPAEYECLFRGALLPRVSAASSNRIIWSVDPDGANLDACLQDVADQLPEAFAWFARLEDRAEVLRILLEGSEDMERLWGFGGNPSPSRAYHAGYVALSMGDKATAMPLLQDAVDSGSYVKLFTSVDAAIKLVS